MSIPLGTRISVASLLAVVLLVGCPLMFSAVQAAGESCHSSGDHDDASTSLVDCCLADQRATTRFTSTGLTELWEGGIAGLAPTRNLTPSIQVDALRWHSPSPIGTRPFAPTLFLLNAAFLI